MGWSRYDQESERLAKLPRAERFEALLEFPLDYTIKAIGRGQEFWNEVRETLDRCGYKDVILVERPSTRKRFFSITFSVNVESGVALDRVYGALQEIPSLVYLL